MNEGHPASSIAAPTDLLFGGSPVNRIRRLSCCSSAPFLQFDLYEAAYFVFVCTLFAFVEFSSASDLFGGSFSVSIFKKMLLID